MKKKTLRKLVLTKETLRLLQDSTIKKAAAGVSFDSMCLTCINSPNADCQLTFADC